MNLTNIFKKRKKNLWIVVAVFAVAVVSIAATAKLSPVDKLEIKVSKLQAQTNYLQAQVTYLQNCTDYKSRVLIDLLIRLNTSVVRSNNDTLNPVQFGLIDPDADFNPNTDPCATIPPAPPN